MISNTDKAKVEGTSPNVDSSTSILTSCNYTSDISSIVDSDIQNRNHYDLNALQLVTLDTCASMTFLPPSNSTSKTSSISDFENQSVNTSDLKTIRLVETDANNSSSKISSINDNAAILPGSNCTSDILSIIDSDIQIRDHYDLNALQTVTIDSCARMRFLPTRNSTSKPSSISDFDNQDVNTSDLNTLRLVKPETNLRHATLREKCGKITLTWAKSTGIFKNLERIFIYDGALVGVEMELTKEMVKLLRTEKYTNYDDQVNMFKPLSLTDIPSGQGA